MRFFPLSPPTLALSISEEALCLVEIKKHWRKTLLQHVTRVPLPQGVIKLSSAKANIENPDEFLVRFKSMVAPLRRPQSIVLSLPDLCARTTVFDFSTFPTKKQEQTALINWRFQQDLKLDVSHSRLAFGIYVPTSVTESPTPGNAEHVRVLGTAIRNEIIEQFEKICLEAQMIPTSVGISGLDIFDLYRSTIQDILEVENRQTGSLPSEAIFLFISQWGFTFLAVQEGSPRFIRTKAIAVKPESDHSSNDSPLSESDRVTGADGQTSSAPGEAVPAQALDDDHSHSQFSSFTAIKFEKEILATLQYFLETFFKHNLPVSPINLFVATDLPHGHNLVPPADHIQQTLKASGSHDPQIRITALSQHSYVQQEDTHLDFKKQEELALPGYAGLMVA